MRHRIKLTPEQLANAHLTSRRGMPRDDRNAGFGLRQSRGQRRSARRVCAAISRHRQSGKTRGWAIVVQRGEVLAQIESNESLKVTM